MARVITFSRTYPSYHPKKGQPTYFIEKILSSFRATVCFTPNTPTHFYPNPDDLYELNKDKPYLIISEFIKQIGNYSDKYEPKHHTIRSGHRFKAGDKFSPRVWSGKPYNSKQIIIAPDVEVVKTWYFQIQNDRFFIESEKDQSCREITDISLIAKNDGLEIIDFKNWFFLSPKFKKNKSFDGQIICWNNKIEY
ncbi:MAG: hypothetical protein U0T69_11245 [Chitinophagales bacterium]